MDWDLLPDCAPCDQREIDIRRVLRRCSVTLGPVKLTYEKVDSNNIDLPLDPILGFGAARRTATNHAGGSRCGSVQILHKPYLNRQSVQYAREMAPELLWQS